MAGIIFGHKRAETETETETILRAAKKPEHRALCLVTEVNYYLHSI